MMSTKSKSNRSLFSTSSRESVAIPPVLEEDENDISETEEQKVASNSNSNKKSEKNNYTSFRFKKLSIVDDVSVNSSVDEQENSNIMEDVSLEVNSGLNIDVQSSESQSFVSNTITSSMDEEHGINVQSSREMDTENSKKSASSLGKKERKMAIIGTLIIALTIITVTISVTVGGLLVLREEESIVFNSTRQSSTPTIISSSFPSFSPSILNTGGDDIEEPRSIILSMNPSSLIPSTSPSIHINRRRTHIPTHSSKPNNTMSTINNTTGPSSTPLISINLTQSIGNATTQNHNNKTGSPTNETSVQSLMNSTSISNVANTNIPIPSEILNTSMSQQIISSNTSISVSNFTSPFASGLAVNKSSSWKINATIPIPYFEVVNEESRNVIDLSADGSRIAVSIPSFNASMGVVVIYQFVANQWNEITSIYGNTNGDKFGFSICFSPDGRTIAVGAVDENNNGYVKIFNEVNFTSWIQSGDDLISGAETGSGFGYSLSFSPQGDEFVVGVPFASTNGLSSSGRVDLFKYIEDNAVWVSNGSGLDGKIMHGWFGYSVSLGNNILVVGAPKSSCVHVYHKIETSVQWELKGNQINGRNPDDFFGQSVSISSNGNLMVVGAPLNSLMGVDTGVISVYESINDTYIHKSGGDVYGTSSRSNYGTDFSITDNGTSMVIGGSEARAFESKSGLWSDVNLDIAARINHVAIDISMDGTIIAAVNEPGKLQIFSRE